MLEADGSSEIFLINPQPPLKSLKLTCRVCLEAQAHYRCPKCDIKTCSVDCSNRHKREEGCTAQKPPTDEKPRKEMGDQDLLKDFRFLERVGTSVESQARLDSELTAEKFGIPFASMVPTRKPKNSVPLKLLRQKAEENGVLFKGCPARLSRRRNNTTCLSNGKKFKRLRWRLEWIICPIQGRRLEHIDKAVSQDVVMNQLVERFGKTESLYKGDRDVWDLVKPPTELAVLMADLSVPCNKRSYLLLDPTKQLRDWLANSVVVEYPTFYIVPNSEIMTKDDINNSKTKVDDFDVSTSSETSTSDSDSDSSSSSRLSHVTASSDCEVLEDLLQPNHVEEPFGDQPRRVDLTSHFAEVASKARGGFVGCWGSANVYNKLYDYEFPGPCEFEQRPRNLPETIQQQVCQPSEGDLITALSVINPLEAENSICESGNTDTLSCKMGLCDEEYSDENIHEKRREIE